MKQLTILALICTIFAPHLSAATVSVRNVTTVPITLEQVTTKSSRSISCLDFWPTPSQGAFRITPTSEEIVSHMKYKVAAGSTIELEVADLDDDTWDHFKFVATTEDMFGNSLKRSFHFSSRGQLSVVYHVSDNGVCPLRFSFEGGPYSGNDRLSYYVITLMRTEDGRESVDRIESHYLIGK